MQKKIAVIGSGPAGSGFIEGLEQQAAASPAPNLTANDISEIHIFDTSAILGAGTPYDPSVADAEHILNGHRSHLPKEFIAWINSESSAANGATINNKDRIESNFQKIFELRLREKFLKRFGCEYDSEKRAEYVGAQKDLCDHYDAIWESFKRRHLGRLSPQDIEKSWDFYPRTLFGMFEIDQFEEAVKSLESKGFSVIRHPKTEVTSIEKKEGEKLVLKFAGGSLEVDNVAIATGYGGNTPTWQSNRYFHKIWPISDVKKGVSKAIEDELRSRAESGDANKEIVIAIEGKGLSAIDVAKTLLQDGELRHNEDDGSFTFYPDKHSDHRIKLLMISRTPLIHKAMSIGAVNWYMSKIFDQGNGVIKYPDELKFTKDVFEQVAKESGNTIRLWQVAIMFARAIEEAYRAGARYADRVGNIEEKEGAERKATNAREFLHKIIDNIEKDEADIAAFSSREGREEFEKFMNGLKGSPQSQLEAIQKQFHLRPINNANYSAILANFNEAIGFSANVDAWQQMRADLHDAEHGDVAGFVVWRQFLFLFYGNFRDLLPEEDRNYRFREERSNYFGIFGRYQEVLSGMPQITVKELLAFHEAGSLDLVTLGMDIKKSYLSDTEAVGSSARIVACQNMQRRGIDDEAIIAALGKDKKVVFEGDGKKVVCDIAINAGSKYGPGFIPNPLQQSLVECGIMKQGKSTASNVLIIRGGNVTGARKLGSEAAIKNFSTAQINAASAASVAAPSVVMQPQSNLALDQKPASAAKRVKADGRL